MTLQISESYVSRPFTVGLQTGRELVYDVIGADPSSISEEEDVEALLRATAPGSYLGRMLETINAENLGGGIWKGTAKYVTQEVELSFDTEGGTQKITQSYATVGYAPAGFYPPDFEGAIGVTQESVEGVDVPVPTYSFTETHRWDDSVVTEAYRLTLFNLTGRWNDALFKGFAIGECMFMGASGQKRGDDLWSVSYKFSCSPNVSGAVVGTITGIDKQGWDYLWIRYGEFVDTTAKRLIQKPIACYVERVSLPGDLSQLLIGV